MATQLRPWPALAAAKLHIPVAHVEAGLRSFNMQMPEEINRVVADWVSTLLFYPTEAAVANLRNEGVSKGVHNVGNVMYDVSYSAERAMLESTVLRRLGLTSHNYVLTTFHHAENTDNPERLCGILYALTEIARSLPVVLPLHPRSRKQLLGLAIF